MTKKNNIEIQYRKSYTKAVFTFNVKNIDNGSMLILPSPAGAVSRDLFLLCIIINHSRPI